MILDDKSDDLEVFLGVFALQGGDWVGRSPVIRAGEMMANIIW